MKELGFVRSHEPVTPTRCLDSPRDKSTIFCATLSQGFECCSKIGFEQIIRMAHKKKGTD